jgi:hypothetical protein
LTSIPTIWFCTTKGTQTPINWQSIHAPRKKRGKLDLHQNGKEIPNTRGLTSTSFSRVSLQQSNVQNILDAFNMYTSNGNLSMGEVPIEVLV